MDRTDAPDLLPDPPAAVGGGSTGAFLMLVGAGLTAVALFLPRFHVAGVGGETTVTGISGVGVGLLFLSGFAAALALATILPELVAIRFAFPLLAGALMSLLVYRRWSDLNNALDGARTLPGIEASIGIGFWLTVVGASLVLAGGAVMQFERRRA